MEKCFPIMLSCICKSVAILHKFNISFLSSYLNHKIMSSYSYPVASSCYFYVASQFPCSLQYTFSNSYRYAYMYQHFEFLFVAFATFSLTKSSPQIHQNLTILCKTSNSVLYSQILSVMLHASNLCLLCLHYAQCFCHPLCLA